MVDPNKARFKKVVRIFAFVLRFIKKLQKKSKICQPTIAQKTSCSGILRDEEISASENCFFKTATSEVKEIVKKNEYQKIPLQKDGAVYFCMSTSATLIKVMEDYSTIAFIQSFVRFSCEVGYPKLLSVDEGCQLVKGYESMKLT